MRSNRGWTGSNRINVKPNSFQFPWSKELKTHFRNLKLIVEHPIQNVKDKGLRFFFFFFNFFFLNFLLWNFEIIIPQRKWKTTEGKQGKGTSYRDSLKIICWIRGGEGGDPLPNLSWAQSTCFSGQIMGSSVAVLFQVLEQTPTKGKLCWPNVLENKPDFTAILTRVQRLDKGETSLQCPKSELWGGGESIMNNLITVSLYGPGNHKATYLSVDYGFFFFFLVISPLFFFFQIFSRLIFVFWPVYIPALCRLRL